MNNCPCGSGAIYHDCCARYHHGQAVAADAQTLMKSRFCAFYLGNIDYIIATTVPAEQALLDKASLQAWADGVRWHKLDVVSHSPKIGKRHAQVHFRAYFCRVGEDIERCHDEHSAFVNIEGRWYFLDPTLPIKLTNKQPCLCGSGEKFKACCGKFLA